MRAMVMLGAGVALTAAGTAGAQTRVIQHGPGASFPQPGRVIVHGPHRPMPPAHMPMRPSRWGSKIGGQWWGGVNAPGGWAAYRQPVRGYRLPTYWVAPRFYVTDWRLYGLTAPQGGYNWARYYDDAVLIDRSGAVYDHRSGVDWDREVYVDRDIDDERGGSGIGGAVAGAVVGGVAGNVIAGRGDKLAGTLVGAGVGAAAGMAIDRAHDRRREERRVERYERYDDRGEPPMAPDRGPPPHGHHEGHGDDMIVGSDGPEYRHGPMGGRPSGSTWRSADGRTTIVTQGGAYMAGHGYGAGGPVILAPAGAVTTVTIASAPVVTTTTTTEYYEDAVTYTRAPVVKRKLVKRVWRAKAKPRCICR